MTNAAAIRQIEAIRTAYEVAGVLPVEDCAEFIRTIARSWKLGALDDVGSTIHAIAFEVSRVVDVSPECVAKARGAAAKFDAALA